MKEADVAGLIEQFKTIRELARKFYNLAKGKDGSYFRSEIKELCERYNSAINSFNELKGDSTTFLEQVYIPSDYTPRGDT